MTEKIKWHYRYGGEFKGRIIEQLNSDTAKALTQESCRRCGGGGGSDKWAHTGWTCYDCGGSGKGPIREIKVYTLEKIEKLDAAAEKRAEKMAAKRKAKAEAEEAARLSKLSETQEKLAECLPELVEILRSIPTFDDAPKYYPNFLLSMRKRFDDGHEFSENMIDGIFKAMIAQEEREAVDARIKAFEDVGGEVEEGRQELTAIMLSYKRQWNEFGYRPESYIMKALFITDKGFKIYGTMPRGVTDLDRGCLFKFKATVERSPDDPRFGFYKRPSEAVELQYNSEV